MPISISVRNSRELQATVLAIASVGKELKKQLRVRTKAMIVPEWKKGVAERAYTRQDHAVLVRSARVDVRDTNVVLRSGGVGKLTALTSATEFGVDHNRVKVHPMTSRKGKKYEVKRHTTRQMPRRYTKGRVVYPTAKDLIPRLAALWVQTTIKTFYEQLQRK